MGVSGQRQCLASLYLRGNDPRYPLYRRLGGPQSRSGHRGYRKNPLPLSGIEPRSTGRPVCSQDTTLTELPQLLLKMGRLITSEVNLTKHQNLSRTGRAGKQEEHCNGI
jgi:hypothetical protein